jgi:nitrile hydratase subunit alpha
MSDGYRISLKPNPVAERAAALEAALTAHGVLNPGFVEKFTSHAEEQLDPKKGARVVARAWTDAGFRERLLSDGKSAVAEMGFALSEYHGRLVVLENTPDVHNVIVCTLCSCTATTIIGAPPGWYKDLEYRARVVRESRTVLKEMGLDLPSNTEIRVWDTTTDTRYMVLPMQPHATGGWSEERLADVVTQASMIGTSRLDMINTRTEG